MNEAIAQVAESYGVSKHLALRTVLEVQQTSRESVQHVAARFLKLRRRGSWDRVVQQLKQMRPPRWESLVGEAK